MVRIFSGIMLPVSMGLLATPGEALQQKRYGDLTLVNQTAPSAKDTVRANNRTTRCFGNCGDVGCDKCVEDVPTAHASIARNSSALSQNRGYDQKECDCVLKGSDCQCTGNCDDHDQLDICEELS